MTTQSGTLPVVTRFAPSPTGFLHAGNYRTAVFAYLFARQQGGKFIVRIEDTDRARFEQKYQDNILESLAWLELEYDEIYIQSQRQDRHRELMQRLVDEGKAYVSDEQAKDGSGIIKHIVRLRNPGEQVTLHDIIRGKITIDTTDLGDFAIGRSINEPLFHFAVVADDADMGVTHVVRGDDHIANTPRQILISRALGYPDFTYAHLPLVFGTDKQKLSKRRGAKALTEYRDEGYLPDAVLNFMVSLGWNQGEGEENEIYSKEQLISIFTLDRVQRSPAVFNPEKLDWFNREYIKMMSSDEQFSEVKKRVEQLPGYTDEILSRALPIIIERVSKWSDIDTLIANGEIGYFWSDPVVDPTMLVWKQDTLESAHIHLKQLCNILQTHTSDWTVDALKSLIMPYAEEHGRGNVLWPLRVALSGREKSPDPFTIMYSVGKDVTLHRIIAIVE